MARTSSTSSTGVYGCDECRLCLESLNEEDMEGGMMVKVKVKMQV